jgi:hypothetical protein
MPLHRALFYYQMAKTFQSDSDLPNIGYGRANTGNKRPFARSREECGHVPARRSAA